DGTVPEHEIAVRIVRAAEENLAALRLALDDHAALVGIVRAQHPGRLVFDEFALRVFRARGELAEAALFDHEVRPAPGTLLLENLVGFGRLQPALLGGDQLARGL